MPLISEFLGIQVYMYWDDHNPPHFHAEYGGMTSVISIRDAAAISGFLPSRQLKLVLAWCEMRRDELLENCERAERHGELLMIEPLN